MPVEHARGAWVGASARNAYRLTGRVTRSIERPFDASNQPVRVSEMVTRDSDHAPVDIVERFAALDVLAKRAQVGAMDIPFVLEGQPRERIGEVGRPNDAIAVLHFVPDDRLRKPRAHEDPADGRLRSRIGALPDFTDCLPELPHTSNPLRALYCREQFRQVRERVHPAHERVADFDEFLDVEDRGKLDPRLNRLDHRQPAERHDAEPTLQPMTYDPGGLRWMGGAQHRDVQFATFLEESRQIHSPQQRRSRMAEELVVACTLEVRTAESVEGCRLAARVDGVERMGEILSLESRLGDTPCECGPGGECRTEIRG